MSSEPRSRRPVRLPEDLVQALRDSVASSDDDPDVYLAIEKDETILMVGLIEGELYMHEGPKLVSKLEFVSKAEHVPIERLAQSQRRSIMLGYAAWANEQAAGHGLREPIIA